MSSANGTRMNRHDEAVIQAEVHRLANALKPFRILHRDALERVAGAENWHEGGFDRALREAVRAGAVESLPGGFYRDAQDGHLDDDGHLGGQRG